MRFHCGFRRRSALRSFSIAGWPKWSGRCGRVRRHTRRLPTSEAFPTRSWIQSSILGFSYTFYFICFSHIIELLTNLFFNSELQLGYYDIPESLQTHSMWRTLNFTISCMTLRLSSRFLLSPRRNVYGFWFSFLFYEYFCLLNALFLKIQDSNTSLFPWLVNIQFEGLIVQTSRVERHLLVVLRACWCLERRYVNRAPRGWTTPQAIPVH
jgi:hypothetical protein